MAMTLQEYRRRWQVKNHDRLKSYKKDWYLENKERLQEKHRSYYQQNKDRIKAQRFDHKLDLRDRAKARKAYDSTFVIEDIPMVVPTYSREELWDTLDNAV